YELFLKLLSDTLQNGLCKQRKGVIFSLFDNSEVLPIPIVSITIQDFPIAYSSHKNNTL
ncbi:27377_t:CDS:1, partial [Gigaspora margarita]